MLRLFLTYSYFLGLRTLTVIQNAVKLAQKSEGIELDLSKIDYNDQAVLGMIGSGKCEGVFQLESTGMKKGTGRK